MFIISKSYDYVKEKDREHSTRKKTRLNNKMTSGFFCPSLKLEACYMILALKTA